MRARGLPVPDRANLTLADLENITSAWVSWYNERRLMHRLGRRPPAEAEAEYYARLHAESTPVTRNEVCTKLPDAVSRAIFPRLSRDSTADPAWASSTLAAATKELLALGIAIPFGFALVGSWLLGFLYGPTFAEYAWLLVAFGMAMPFRYVGLIFGFALTGAGLQTRRTRALAIAVAVSLILNIVLIPMIGVAGALIAVVVNWAIYCALLVVDVRRIFGRTLWLRDVVNPLGSAIVAFLVGVVVRTVVGGRLGDPLAGLAFAGIFAIGMFSPAIRDRFGSKSKA